MAKKGTTARSGGGSKSRGATGKARRAADAGRRAATTSKGTASGRRGKKTGGRTPARGHPGAQSAADKVGSNRRKAGTFASRNDFGVPARRATPRGRAPESADGLPRNEEGRSGAAGDRTHGVGSAPSNVGSGSGGDVDTDLVGVGVGTGPVSQRGPTGPTGGPDDATDPSGDFASAPDHPARGSNETGRIPPGAHGAAATRTYDTVDHSGEDANTTH